MIDMRAPEAFWSVPEAELLHGLATSARGLARIEAIRRACGFRHSIKLARMLAAVIT
jgi:hypothetical protein